MEGVISYSGPSWPHKLGDDKGGRRAELPREARLAGLLTLGCVTGNVLTALSPALPEPSPTLPSPRAAIVADVHADFYDPALEFIRVRRAVSAFCLCGTVVGQRGGCL